MEFTEKIKELRKKRSDISKLNSELIQFSSGIFEEFYKYIFDINIFKIRRWGNKRKYL